MPLSFLWTRRSLLSFLNHKESQSMWSCEPGVQAFKEKPLNDHWARTGQLALVRAFPCMSPRAWGTLGVTPFLLILLPCMPSQDLWQQPTVSWVILPGIFPSSYFPQPSIPDPGKFIEHKSFEHVPTGVFVTADLQNGKNMSWGGTTTQAMVCIGKTA